MAIQRPKASLLNLKFAAACRRKPCHEIPAMKSLKVLLLVLLPLGFLLAGCYTAAHPSRPPGVVYVPVAPPPAKIVVRPAPPARHSVWIPGYWYWHGDRHLWRHGYWHRRPPRKHWVPGYWKPYPRGWVRYRGYWRD